MVVCQCLTHWSERHSVVRISRQAPHFIRGNHFFDKIYYCCDYPWENTSFWLAAAMRICWQSPIWISSPPGDTAWPWSGLLVRSLLFWHGSGDAGRKLCTWRDAFRNPENRGERGGVFVKGIDFRQSAGIFLSRITSIAVWCEDSVSMNNALCFIHFTVTIINMFSDLHWRCVYDKV